MNGDSCPQRGCTGSIEDGYCNVCGHAEGIGSSPGNDAAAAGAAAPGYEATIAMTAPMAGVSARTSPATTGTGSTPISRAVRGTSRRSVHTSSHTTRKQLGAGLITLPDLPSAEPEKAVMADAKVPERKRFCPGCDSRLSREAGYCGKCGMKYNFAPSLKAGDVLAGQYEVKGPIAFGGLGWIYLGFDRALSRYVVLKGLLNTADASAAAAAVAERQFLAAVKHPNIVGIYNFVQDGSEGYIVMEYVGGMTLKQIRQERGPLPAAEALAYIHRILSAFAYLHHQGLVYCDFKPDNMMLERDDVKLIDLGGVRRIDDMGGDIYGTVGYSAPEASQEPSPASDVFTIGRTLAVLLTDIHGFSSDHRYTLPAVGEEPLYGKFESLYRLLLKATAHEADDRFESADEMAEQALGVLREIVALESETPRPAPSFLFGPDLLSLDERGEMEPIHADYQQLPVPALDTTDPGAQAISHATGITDLRKRVAALRLATQQAPNSREARLRLAAGLGDMGEMTEAAEILAGLYAEDAWDWRVLWFQGRMKIEQFESAEARKLFDQVYFDLPGELAPKLALGLACELAGDWDVAIAMYDLVTRTDPSYVSAVFGLARCYHAKGDRRAAVRALERAPQSSSLYLRSRIEAARLLIRSGVTAPKEYELAAASAVAESLTLEGLTKFTLASQILGTAAELVSSRTLSETKAVRVLGVPLEETALRAGWEKSLRAMAQFAEGDEKIRLIDRANQVRPRTWF